MNSSNNMQTIPQLTETANEFASAHFFIVHLAEIEATRTLIASLFDMLFVHNYDIQQWTFYGQQMLLNDIN